MPNPIGTITLWSGSIATIPPDWQLCDGTNGTPDLRDRFVQGAGGALNPDDVGGAATHDHAFTGDGHTHTASISVDTAGSGPSAAWGVGPPSNSNAAAGTTDAGDSIPPFFALAYIQHMA